MDTRDRDSESDGDAGMSGSAPPGDEPSEQSELEKALKQIRFKPNKGTYVVLPRVSGVGE